MHLGKLIYVNMQSQSTEWEDAEEEEGEHNDQDFHSGLYLELHTPLSIFSSSLLQNLFIML